MRPDTFLYTSENSDHIQPQVVLRYEYNATMRILNKIQLMIEFRVSFMRVTKCGQIFLRPDISSHTAENRK